ncbi:MAG: hypothetical protein GXO49_00115 [Chlorobi bacterium]|nr:hypothetical protein [Chlorobiota bacterium]
MKNSQFSIFNFQFSILATLIFAFLVSCKDDTFKEEDIDLSKGIFVVNEGNFMANNGEISFYNTETGELTNNIYSKQNNEAVLGDVVQSMCISGDFALISVNNSKKIELVDVNNFKHVSTITDVVYPRYIIPVKENICALTNGKNPGEVCIIDVSKKEITKRITVGTEPENLLLANNKIFVANGAWGHDSTVSIIDAQTLELTKTIVVGDGATDLVSDKNGNIWVLCQGKAEYDAGEDTPSKLVCINPDTYDIIEEVTIGMVGDDFYPTRIASYLNEDYIYYIEQTGVYRININNPQEKEWFIMGSYYGLEINQENGDVYVFFDNGFTSAGIMTIYDKAGNKLNDLLEVGIGPNGCVFK